MTSVDPCAVLGLPVGSSPDAARAARRRLAKQLHPDLHAGASAEERAELSARMTLVNRAVAEVEARSASLDSPAVRPKSASEPDRSPRAGPTPASSRRHRYPDGPRPVAAAIEADTFSVECLPAEAFEALFVVAYALGDILVVDEPYHLELYLDDPAPCFCQLMLAPEAGGSIVTLDVSPPAEGDPGPPAELVRDVFVDELNRLAIT